MPYQPVPGLLDGRYLAVPAGQLRLVRVVVVAGLKEAVGPATARREDRGAVGRVLVAEILRAVGEDKDLGI